jgi:hypothetical protein
MRRLSLILSDLFVPAEASRERALAGEIELPNFAWLLRFSQDPVALADWRSWLATRSGQSAIAELPAAQVAADSIVDPAHLATSWLATPVRLEARLDHVRLADRGLLRVENDESERWCAEFAREFGPDLKLHPAGDRGFVLTGISAAGVATVDPARLLDSDVAQALPSGAAAGPIRRLGAELEIWLHGIPLNAEREQAGRPRISALWIWGGGAVPGAPAVGVAESTGGTFTVHGADPYLPTLARAARAKYSFQSPERFSALDTRMNHMIELTPMSDVRNSLMQLEENWFAPVRAALSAGSLASLDIVANDRWYRIGARPGWRWWRKRRGWLESLVSPVSSSKA